MSNPKDLEIIFAPGCFDDFEGTQEELDEFIAHIKSLAASGELFENATALDLDDLEEMDESDDYEVAPKPAVRVLQ